MRPVGIHMIFSTLSTTLPHNYKLKINLLVLLKEHFKENAILTLRVLTTETHFSLWNSRKYHAWSCQNVCDALTFFACGALAASISVGIVIPSTWFVYLYKQTVSITVVVMGTKQFSDKTTHRQQVKTGFVQKWENRSTGLLQDYSRILPFFKDSISSQFCITQRF